MKKAFSKTELGTIMIEALAMLALISMVTPILYRKTAERTTELQDINTAGEMRSIIKAVDDYISANYDAIIAKKTVTNTCAGTGNNSVNYNGIDSTKKTISVPLGHFCEFLPYGILDGSGNVRESKFFSGYDVVLKVKGSGDPANGDNVVTGFVIAQPATGMRINEMRSNSIASMIGGNGGYVSSVSGEGDNASGVIKGNLGIWGVDDVKSELGVTGVQKNSVVAASIEGISSQNAKIDLDGVLYRKEQNPYNRELHTMSTNLYMGVAGHEMYNILNAGGLAIGAAELENNDSLYIAEGDITIGGNGGINISSGNIKIRSGELYLDSGNVYIGASVTPQMGGQDSLYVYGDIEANSGAFIARDGIVTANQYITSGGNVNISDDLVDLQAPIQVNVAGECTEPGTCALYVTGNARITGNLTVDDTFSAKNLHAQETLTVGGTTPGTGPALKVTYNDSVEGTKLNFGEDLLTVTQTANGGNLKFGGDFVKIDKSDTEKSFRVYDATHVRMNTDINTAGALKNELLMDKDKLRLARASATDVIEQELRMEEENGKPIIRMFSRDGKINLNSKMLSVTTNALKVEPSEEVDTTNITVNGAFRVNAKATVGEGEGASLQTIGSMQYDNTGLAVNSSNAYFTGASDSSRSTVSLKNSNLKIQNKDNVNVLWIASESGSNTGAIMDANKITMRDGSGSDKVLTINLTNMDSDNDATNPIYIRRGAIELKQKEGAGDVSTNTDLNYVKADRFVANHVMPVNALATYNASNKPAKLLSDTATLEYQINPAYTSIMHDIKLTTRGGARLSDILPDFINKGIYVVDNTYAAKYNTGACGAGKLITEYEALTRAQKTSAVTECASLYDQVSPWAGFVPTPVCPPGYSKVITLMPASFAMAQAGIPYEKADWAPSKDLSLPYLVRSPYDYLTGGSETDPAPTPLYFQKNTWMKSFVMTHGYGTNFDGWDVGMGFIYPYSQYKEYIENCDKDGNCKNYSNANGFGIKSGASSLDDSDPSGSDNDHRVIWNLFPVYNGSLEGYATVYCYFNRNGGCTEWYTAAEATTEHPEGSCKTYGLQWNDTLVDVNYDQLERFRPYYSKTGATNTGTGRLNSTHSSIGDW